MKELSSLLTYDPNWYHQYQRLDGSDSSKKSLEADALMHALRGYRRNHPGTILDVGTATARYPIIFSNLGWKATGIDASDAAVSIAQKELLRCGLLHRVEISQGDVRDCEHRGEGFDVITCMMGTFTHIPEADRQSALQRLFLNTKKGGILAVSNWNTEWPNPTTLSLYSYKERVQLLKHSPDTQDLSDMITQAGFTDVRVYNVCPFMDAQIDHWLPWDEQSPRLLQQHLFQHDIVLQGQLVLVTGQRNDH